MAIIRKGDKKAKAELIMRAKKERQDRETKTSPKERVAAGRVKNLSAVKIDPKTKKASYRSPYNDRNVVTPVSGTVMADYKKRKQAPNRVSGVVKGGEVKKGSGIANRVAAIQRAKKAKGK